MDTLGTRIEQVFKAVGIKKIDAARRLNVSSAFITKLCKGETGASDRTISDICREFGVNELWLRHGDEGGPMFKELSRKDAIAAYMGPSISARHLVKEWNMLLDIMRPLAEEIAEIEKPPDA